MNNYEKDILKEFFHNFEKFRLYMTTICNNSCKKCIFTFYGTDNQGYKCCQYKNIDKIKKLIGGED